MQVRSATAADLAEIVRIYNQAVIQTTATFDLERLRLFPALTRIHLTDFKLEIDNGVFESPQLTVYVDKIDTPLNELRRKSSR